MSDKLEIGVWGLTLSAHGTIAIGAAVAIVTMFFVVYYITRKT